MQKIRAWKLHQHPIFGKLDVSAIRGLYRMMTLEPGTICYERFYGMKPIE